MSYQSIRQKNNQPFFEMCIPYMFNTSLLDKYNNVYVKCEKRVLVKKQTEKKNKHYFNSSQTCFLYNFHIIEALYDELFSKDKSVKSDLDKYFNKEHQQTLFLEFQQYKAPLYELLRDNFQEIKSIGLKPTSIMEKFLEFNEKKGKGDKTNVYNFDIDVFLSLLRCMNVNCVLLFHKVAFILNNNINEKYVFIGYDFFKTLTINKGLEQFFKSSFNSKEYNYVYTSLSEPIFNDLVSYVNNECYVVNNILKPIRAVSYYKTNELQTIAQKFGIEIELQVDVKKKKKTKQQLYNSIIDVFMRASIKI